MNETSQVTSWGANGSEVSVRAFVRSSTVTRGSFLIRGCSWPWPTSSAITRAAPRCSSTSLKPPVEAPRSRQSSPAGSTANASSAFASLPPARETYGGGLLDLERRALVDLLARLRCGRGRARRSRAPAPGRGSPRARARRGARRDACALTRCARRARRRSRRGPRCRPGSPRAAAAARAAASSASARAPLSPTSMHVAVPVEDVVDDLEEQPELGGKRPPRPVLALGGAGRADAAHDRRR